MEYRTIRIFPYDHRANTELRTYLAEGWQLHGSPFQARPDEYFQALVLPMKSANLKEPGKGGSLSHG